MYGGNATLVAASDSGPLVIEVTLRVAPLASEDPASPATSSS
jgi:hypothetical protein